MGGGRDFAGRRIYKKIGGKYFRIVPKKSELLQAVRNAEDVQQLTKALNDVGFEGKTDFLDNETFDFATKKNFSIGLSKMAVVYGTDVFKGLHPANLDLFTAAQASFDDFDPDSGIIDVNDRHYKSGNNREWLYRDGGRLGYDHPKNNSDEMVIEHEYAHLLQRKLAEHSDLVKGQIAKRNQWNKELQELDEKLDGFASKYMEIKEKLDSIKYSKVKTRQKLENQIKELQQELFDKKGIGIINDLNRVRNLDSQRLSVKFLDYSDGSTEVIKSLFHSVGAKTPEDVAVGITGNKDAYAGKNWHESHAEAVSDYINNGRKASAISIAYVREMDKLLGVRR